VSCSCCQRAQGRGGELLEHRQAALLGLDQVGDAFLLHRQGLARGEELAAHGALLARGFLALHQVDEGHQLSRHPGMDGAVGQVEDQLHQAGDDPAEGRHAVVRAGLTALDLQAQLAQRVQVQQHPGHQRQQPRGGALGGVELVREQRAQLLLQRGGRLLGGPVLFVELQAVRGQEDAAGPAFALQGVDQLADDGDQFHPGGQVPHGVDVQLLGAQDELGDGQRHGAGDSGHLGPDCPQDGCRPESSGRFGADQHPPVLRPHAVAAHRPSGDSRQTPVRRSMWCLYSGEATTRCSPRLPTSPRESTLAPAFGSTLSMAKNWC
jgi:hypothetical protein